MPIALCNAPATFQRVMELALAGLQWKTCLAYLDDVLAFSDDFSTHISRLSEVLGRIQKANPQAQTSKMSFPSRRGCVFGTYNIKLGDYTKS